jgi:organic hydroperoxide reductase OsmC/OhrA
MREFPHHYTAAAAGHPTGDITLNGLRLTTLRSAPPLEFDGPGDRWSPETLMAAAVADCFVLTFRALARFARMPWLTLTCEASGTLDRVDRITQFTAFQVKARLRIPAGGNVEQAKRLLARAEDGCLIANSLKAWVDLDLNVEVEEAAGIAASAETGAVSAA